MFISNLEKENIHAGILDLQSKISKLTTDVLFLTGKIKALEGAKPVVKRVKKKMTAEQRAKQRQYQKAYNERKKAAKLLNKETNVSS